MVEAFTPEAAELFRQMKQRVDGIDKLARELGDLGRGLPMVEKNVRGILSFTHVLRFGVSDAAEALDTEHA